jgi:tetratricopeptide (TPR) repeat protein
MLVIAAVSALKPQIPPAWPLAPSQSVELRKDLRGDDSGGWGIHARERRSRLSVDMRSLQPPARSSAAEQPRRAPEPVYRGDEIDNARMLETELASGELDSSAAVKYAEHLATSRARDTEYVASVATLLSANLQRSLEVDPLEASELAYTTLIGQLLDGGDAESAQYLAQKAMTQLSDSARIRAALATALAERLFYREAIDVLRQIQEPAAPIQAQLATLLYRQGNTEEAVRLARRLRGWSADAAEMMEEIPE